MVVVVALARVQLPRSPAAGPTRGSDGRDPAHERFQALTIVHVGASDTQRQRQSVPVGDQMVSIPTCHGQSDSVPSEAPFCRPDADGVDRAPRPVQLTPRPEFVQDHTVEPGPDPVPAPLGEPPLDRLPGRTENRRKLPPRAARRRHEHDCGQGLTVTSPTPAPALRTPHLCGLYDPPEQHPQRIRHRTLN